MAGNLKPIDFIVTSKHYAEDYGGTNRGYLNKQRNAIAQTRNIVLSIDDNPSGPPMRARIERGQWIADCECGGATFVDPEDPVTFCFNCKAYNLRPVTFPDNWREIEQVLLERPQNDIAGLTDNERAASAIPVIDVEGKGGLWRNWNPDETIEDLHFQQDEPIKKWRKALKRQ